MAELDAVVGQHRVDLIGHRLDQRAEKVGSRLPRRFPLKPGERELGGPVDRDEEGELAFLRSNLGNVDVEVADRVVGELAALELVAFELGQAADAVPLKTAVQRGSGEMRDARQQAVKVVMERQQDVAPEGDDTASPSGVSTVEGGSLGPIGASVVASRWHHF